MLEVIGCDVEGLKIFGLGCSKETLIRRSKCDFFTQRVFEA